ncbi:hypothetical protein RJ640_017426 [Escallonia rubra]|uniref:CCHC-type domain-containing protein n=1 Tax=Escallonia rubra TaxID=112253 RepID=A0AA88RWQ9_9ASTE|nr:hypothetical protein RJ640_017426 [Escallonia rubra]
MDISKDNQSFQLFSKSALEKHKQKFRYVHIGLVQIGITSLTKEGLDTHVWAALRDDRHLSFDDSLLGIVETSLCNGPMYFNCYPNFSVSLSDPHIMDVLTLDIKTQRYNMRPQAQNLVLIYRIYYKAMSTICPAFKQIADPGKYVILFQSNPDKTNVMLPRRIKFNELTPPEDWVIENKPTHRQVNPQNTQIDHMIETPEGDVNIRFSQPETSSQNYKILHSGNSSQSARYSCSSIPSQNFQSCQNSEYHSIPPSRSSRDPKIIFQGIRNNNSSVPETMYTVETPSEMPSSSGQNQNNYNPSVHDFDYNVLVIEDFQIGHKKLNDEFYAKHNRTKHAWYRISFSTEQRAQYKELFFQTLKAYKTYFPFFGWFYSYCLDNNIEIPEYMNPQKQINVFKRITREWYIWPTHEKQESIHPPFNKFAMKGDMNSNFLAAPLKHIVDTSTSNHLNSVTAVKCNLQKALVIISSALPLDLASSSSSVVKNIEQPLIKPSIDLDSRFKLNSEEPSGKFLKELMSKLGQIKTPKEKYPKVETSQSSPKHINMIGDIGSESEIEPDKLEKQFITAIGATNSRPPLRNYYTRPTPVDMQLEEKNFSNPSSFNGSSIYEWNLDGMTDYQVITLLQHMLMAANSARNRNPGESEDVIARYLIAGFTGQLRGWWDFYLTPTDQNNILNSIKIEPNGNPILINEQPLSDAVTTLVTAITKHFIGNASTVLERGTELLINLRCPTLTHFRWYKGVFLSKLYQRSDAQQDFWKERFIAGLPNLFSERVRTRIRNKHNGALPFSFYTFGELISEIYAEGLVLCNDIKLKNQLKKEHKSGRTELGQFCYQFGYDTLSVPNYGTKEKVSKTRKPFRKPKFSKKYRKEESSRPFKRFSKRKSFSKSKVICHKCGKPGHYANKCYTKQKINELIIDEDLRKQLNEILLNPSDSEDNQSLELNNIDGDINSSCSSSNHSSDHEDTCHDYNSKTDYYKAILDMNGLSINVITSEESIILDLLDKIDDPEKKKQVIFKYLHGKQSPPTPNDSRQIPTIGNTFNFSTVMDRLQTIEPKGPSIQDLQGEILSLKRDVKTLSTRISLLELHNIEEVRSEEEEEEIYLNDNNNRLKINPDIINDTKIPSPSKEQEILSIDRVVFQKWYVSIKIVISKDFTFEGIALIDSGADLNCIKEGLVPTKIKLRAKTLPCLCLPLPEAFKIVETDASDIGYGGILKQRIDGKMTPPRTQKSGKGLLPRPNRYNLRKSIGSSSSQPSREAMLGKFENSGYNAHAHCPDIIQIEDEEQDLSPIEVANNYLTNGWAYPQKASDKSRDYYEEILRLTKSAVFTHNFEKPPRHSSSNIELPFQFSKIEILKFITKRQWGIDPTRIRELPPHFSHRHYNYFNYIDAWNHVLLYQNPSQKHSWFIFFSRNFDGNFPNWINNWWLNYGPDFEEWPSNQVTEAYQLYAPMVKGLSKLQFMVDFGIPWILCWQYAIQKSTNSSLEYPPTLVQQFGSKWWPKFDDSHCNIEAVAEIFPTLKAASIK